MEDHRLKAFCLVVEKKSFSKAAADKMMTQSAVSHLIKNLEEEMGVKLLNRSGKKVIPTPAGWLFYKQSKNILEAYKTLGDDINKLIKEVKGPLHMGASTTVAKYLLSQVLHDFSKQYSQVHINLTVANTEVILQELQRGNAHIGFVEGNINDKGMFTEDIAQDEIDLIVSEENPLAKKEHITQQDILSHPFIMPQAGSGLREFLEQFFRASKIDPKSMNVSMTLGDPDLIVQMVQSGLGISFVSRWSIIKPMQEGTIRILKFSGRSLFRKYYLVSLLKDAPTMAARTFRNFIKGYRFIIPI